jgi:hypothetical protein
MNADEAVGKLDVHGYVQIAGRFRTTEEAFDFGKKVAETSARRHGLLPLSVIGDFVVPPLDGGATRDFQTLHLDFGLPLDPKIEQDVAFYTALFVPTEVLHVQAETRLVPLNKLLRQRLLIRPGNCRDFSSWKRMEHDKQFIAEAIPR